MQQTTYQADIINSRPLHMLQPQNMQTDKLIHWILSWNTSKTIQCHIVTGPSRAISITLKAHMMNNNQKTICRKVDRNTYKEQ